MASAHPDYRPWNMRVVFTDEPRPLCLYTLYFLDGGSLTRDMPAVDKNGRFLWCRKRSELPRLLRAVHGDLRKRGSLRRGCIDHSIPRLYEGLKLEDRAPEWLHCVDHLNHIWDCLTYLEESRCVTTPQKFIGALADHLLMKDKLSTFRPRDKSVYDLAIENLGVAFAQIYANSRIL